MNISLSKTETEILIRSIGNYMASLMADCVVTKDFHPIVADFERQIKELEPILEKLNEELEKH